MSDVEQWRWVDADGSEHAVVRDELQRLLATGVLPPYVLVWTPPWVEWLHAMHVAELSPFLGSLAKEPHVPATADDARTPPPPPLERYDTVGHARERPMMGVPPPPSSLHPPIAVRMAPPAPPVMRRPIAVRNVMPTLTDEGHSERSNTLRPMGAMPPPPRAMPPQGNIPIFDDLDRTSSESGEFAPASGRGATLAQLVDAKTYETTAVAPTPIPEKDTTPPLRRKAAQRNVWLGAVVLGTIAAVAIWLLAVRDKSEGRSATNIKGSDRTAVGGYCVQQGPVQRLAPSGVVSVPPLFANAIGSRVAVGFAAGPRRAVGMTLDPSTLAFDVPFQRDATNDILGVVPVSAGKNPTFAIDQQDPRFAQARTVGGEHPFTLAFTKDGLVRRDEHGTEVVWRGDWKPEDATVPRVASAPGIGHAVALRIGEKNPEVFSGFLAPDGKVLTSFARLQTTASNVGMPSVAVGDESILVAFATQGPDRSAKPSKDRASQLPWQIALAAAPLGKLPATVVAFAPPAGGPGENAISPSAAGLRKGRFLLQWTEGSAGARVVRAVTLGGNLAPQGETITLSPPGSNAGQGALWAQGDRAIALFFVQNVGTHELWGATLKCP